MTDLEILSGLITVGLFTVMCSGQTSQELSSDYTQLSQHETDNELVEALTALWGDFRPIYQRQKNVELLSVLWAPAVP